VSRSGTRWAVLIGLAAVITGAVAWAVVADGRLVRLCLRVFEDREALRQALLRAGPLAPVVFIAVQALQVIISPIPGELTGFLGGYVFGEALGFVYSSIGLSLGSVAAFAAGRWLGSRFVRRVVSEATWQRLGFLARAEGAALCFIVYAIPGFPKDIVSYLFGLGPMPFWVFAVLASIGRMPGTWILSAQGARTASGRYTELLLITLAAAAVALPIYWLRHRIVSRLRTTTPAAGSGGATP
jgi:uncharacterized membrane protein YdjX (TVP38/TMEM64 family)